MVFGGLTGGSEVSIVIRAVDKFSGAFKNVNRELEQTNKRMQKDFGAISQTARNTGIAFTIFGVAGVAAMTSMVKEAASFESAFTGVRKTVELSEEGFADLENRFKEITKTTPITFQELSAIGEIAGQLGVEGVNNLAKFTKTIADISVTTNLTAEEAATSFARIANVMQEPLENIDRMGAVIVGLGNNFATTEGEIATFAQRIAASGKGAGLTTADIMGISTAFSAVGIQAERGGTAVSKTIDVMVKAVAFGGKKLDVFAETAGLTADEFKEVFEKDAAEAFELFVLGLGKQGDDVFKTFEKLELEDQRLVQSFRAVAGAGDLITRSIETSKEEWKKNTSLVKEAEKRYKTFESKVEIVRNEFKILVAGLGEELIPLFEDLISVASDVIGWFDDLEDSTKKWIVRIGAGATALALFIGPLMLFVSTIPSIVTAIGTISTAISKIGKIPGIGTIGKIAAPVVSTAAVTAGLAVSFKAITEPGLDINNILGPALIGMGLKSRKAGLWAFGLILVVELILNPEVTSESAGKFTASLTNLLLKVGDFLVDVATQIGKRIVNALFGLDLDVDFTAIKGAGASFMRGYEDELTRLSKEGKLAQSFIDVDLFKEDMSDMSEQTSLFDVLWAKVMDNAEIKTFGFLDATKLLGFFIGNSGPGSFPLVYALGLAKDEWDEMTMVALNDIQNIILELESIPRDITTTVHVEFDVDDVNETLQDKLRNMITT